jgi:hypothetical protein
MFRRPARGRTRVPRSPAARLLVEWLEDRTQPATVTSTADAGPGTLREAVQTSAPGDFIDFALPPGFQFINLTSGELVLPHDLFILGPGADQLVVSGSNASRVFRVTGGSVFMFGLTVADGRVASPEVGGGILNDASLNLIDVVVRDSEVDPAAGTAEGGGIFNTTAG